MCTVRMCVLEISISKLVQFFRERPSNSREYVCIYNISISSRFLS